MKQNSNTGGLIGSCIRDWRRFNRESHRLTEFVKLVLTALLTFEASLFVAVSEINIALYYYDPPKVPRVKRPAPEEE